MIEEFIKKEMKSYLCYELEENYGLFFEHRPKKDLKYKHIHFGRDGGLRIKEGYKWNGCSPKINFFGMVVGTPEGVIDKQTMLPKTYYPSLVHDAFYTLNNIFPGQVGMTRSQVDFIFLKMLWSYKFRAAILYYFMVRIFGRKAWKKII